MGGKTSDDPRSGCMKINNTGNKNTAATLVRTIRESQTVPISEPVLLSVNVTTALMFVVAGGMFVAGAVGVEHQSAWFAEFNLLDTLEYRKQTLLEEGLEMISVTLFIHAAIRHLRKTQVATG